MSSQTKIRSSLPRPIKTFSWHYRALSQPQACNSLSLQRTLFRPVQGQLRPRGSPLEEHRASSVRRNAVVGPLDRWKVLSWQHRSLSGQMGILGRKRAPSDRKLIFQANKRPCRADKGPSRPTQGPLKSMEGHFSSKEGSLLA